MKTAQTLLFFSLSLCACQVAERVRVDETYYFVTKLGSDTLAVEKILLTSDAISSTVVLRSPRTTVQNAKLEFDENGKMLNYSREVINAVTDSVILEESALWDGDSLVVSREVNGQSRTANVSSDKSIVPFIDMVHWPFELMINRGYSSEDQPYKQQVFSGTRTFTFEITKLRNDSITVKHPTRGVMGVIPTTNGTLQFLEASNTTRALTVTRTSSLDIEKLIERFRNNDANSKSFGSLSGRGNFDQEVNGVHYKLDFGTPSKRGREIWGKLLTFGKLWRTGANRATHFTIDKDIILGDLEVPAGEYTLFTIPEENGGVLIVNKQTGQNGQRYDETQDLGRTQMTTKELDPPVEVFDIEVSRGNPNNELLLKWGSKAYVIPINPGN